jgi:hypothetical protein
MNDAMKDVESIGARSASDGMPSSVACAPGFDLWCLEGSLPSVDRDLAFDPMDEFATEAGP